MHPSRFFLSLVAFALCSVNAAELSVPILCYHRIREVPVGATTVTPDHFRGQLQTLSDNGFKVIPLRELVAWKLGTGPAPKPNSVVITFDDGHASFYNNARPIIDEFKVPVTMFLVTSCISHGTYCVDWDEVSSLEADPLISLESHTVDHPDFRRQQRRRAPQNFVHYADAELEQSKLILQTRLNKPVDMLAWPYGIYNQGLLRQASKDGYAVGFSVECRSVTQADPTMAIPRCMVLNSDNGESLLQFLKLADAEAGKKTTERKWRLLPPTAETLVSKVQERHRTNIE